MNSHDGYWYHPYGSPLADTRPAMLPLALRAYNNAFIQAHGAEAYGGVAPKRQPLYVREGAPPTTRRWQYLYAEEAERLDDLRRLAWRGKRLWRLAVPLALVGMLAFGAGLYAAITDLHLLALLLLAWLGANVGVVVLLLAVYTFGRLADRRQARRAARRAQQEARGWA